MYDEFEQINLNKNLRKIGLEEKCPNMIKNLYQNLIVHSIIKVEHQS